MNVCLCLYVDGVWIGAVVFEVWMKNKKMVAFGENELDDEFRWIDVMIRCLFFFWMTFDFYKLVCKVWGQGDRRRGFWVKNWKFPRGNNQNRVTCSGVTHCDELELVVASWTGQQPMCFGHLGSIRAIPNWFFWCT